MSDYDRLEVFLLRYILFQPAAIIFALITVIRVWLLYFDMNISKLNLQLSWRSVLNSNFASENWFYIKQHKLGNEIYLLKRGIIAAYLFDFLTAMLRYYNFEFYERLITWGVYMFASLFIAIIWCKLRNFFYDTLFIRKEFILLFFITLFFVLLFLIWGVIIDLVSPFVYNVVWCWMSVIFTTCLVFCHVLLPKLLTHYSKDYGQISIAYNRASEINKAKQRQLKFQEKLQKTREKQSQKQLKLQQKQQKKNAKEKSKQEKKRKTSKSDTDNNRNNTNNNNANGNVKSRTASPKSISSKTTPLKRGGSVPGGNVISNSNSGVTTPTGSDGRNGMMTFEDGMTGIDGTDKEVSMNSMNSMVSKSITTAENAHWSHIIVTAFGFESLMKHLEKEFAIENLLFISEVCCVLLFFFLTFVCDINQTVFSYMLQLQRILSLR